MLGTEGGLGPVGAFPVPAQLETLMCLAYPPPQPEQCFSQKGTGREGGACHQIAYAHWPRKELKEGSGPLNPP